MRIWPVILCLLAFGAGALADGPHTGTLRGKPRIVSGERLVVAGIALRLAGIDAPEPGQHCRLRNGRRYVCGRISATALMDLTAGVDVVCTLSGRKRGGLPLARCRAGGYDLSKGMVHAGWALAWPRASGIYTAMEGASRNSRHGLWQGRFDMPWDWRRGIRTVDNGMDDRR